MTDNQYRPQVGDRCGHHDDLLERPTNRIIAEKYGHLDAACRSCFPELFTRSVPETAPTLEQIDHLVAWARRVYFETNDVGRCPYYLGTGTCSFGCRDEPSCQTDIWTIDVLDGEQDEEGDVPQVKAWLSDLLDPYWHGLVFGAADNEETP